MPASLTERLTKGEPKKPCEIWFEDAERNEKGFCTFHRDRDQCTPAVTPNKNGRGVVPSQVSKYGPVRRDRSSASARTLQDPWAEFAGISDVQHSLRSLSMMHRLLCKNKDALRMDDDDTLVLELDEAALAELFGGDDNEQQATTS